MVASLMAAWTATLAREAKSSTVKLEAGAISTTTLKNTDTLVVTNLLKLSEGTVVHRLLEKSLL